MEPMQILGWLKLADIGIRIFGPGISKIKDRFANSGEASQLPRPETAAEMVGDLDDTLEMAQDQLQRFEESGSASVARRTFEFQQTQKLASRITTFKIASEILGDDQVPDVEPDDELYSRIFGDVGDVSTDKKRIIYAKILAGEVKQPGSTSLKALSILRDMDQPTARLFRLLCSLAVSVRLTDERGTQHIVDVRVLSLGSNAATNSLRPYGLSFDILNELNEHGLVISDYNSYSEAYNLPIVGNPQRPVLPFTYQDSTWVLTPNDDYVQNQQFQWHGVALTKAGKELSLVVDVEAHDDYTTKLQEFFNSLGLNMVNMPVRAA